MIRELRQFAHRVSITAPSVDLLRDHFEGDHLDSFSDGLSRLLHRKLIVRTRTSMRVIGEALGEGLFQ